jgi:hypothetical protein
MKTVVTSNEIGHLWAYQQQDHARAASMSFQGKEFSSFATTIAQIVETPKCEKVFLVSKDRYSSFTGKHLNKVVAAIPKGFKVIYVPGTPRAGIDFSKPSRIMRAWAGQVDRLLSDSAHARQPKKSRLLVEAHELVQTMRKFDELFDLNTVEFPKIPATVEELKAAWDETLKRERIEEAKRQEEERIRQEKQREEYREKMNAWLSGQSDATWLWSNSFPTQLRIKDGQVETSKGAHFPVTHARAGLALVKKTMAEGICNTFTSDPGKTRLGPYTIDRITEDGTVHAGCHVVTYDAIQRIASELES